jgi:hypothetical protein
MANSGCKSSANPVPRTVRFVCRYTVNIACPAMATTSLLHRQPREGVSGCRISARRSMRKYRQNLVWAATFERPCVAESLGRESEYQAALRRGVSQPRSYFAVAQDFGEKFIQETCRAAPRHRIWATVL